ncbi:zinc finger protein 300-like protein [Moniliophthora roreri]|nr:zinc finger protein 300-like protein [Moniliophthora roreri]
MSSGLWILSTSLGWAILESNSKEVRYWPRSIATYSLLQEIRWEAFKSEPEVEKPLDFVTGPLAIRLVDL